MTAISVGNFGLDFVPDTWYSSVSPASGSVWSQWSDAREHFAVPVSRLSIKETFSGLAETWREERGPTSSLDELVLSAPYQRIIALGRDVVPHILGELVRRPDHWFWALSVLTEADPVPDEAAGNVQAMADAWVQWGRDEGLIS